MNSTLQDSDTMPLMRMASPSLRQLVKMNQTSTLIHVVDRDSSQNGPPFHFSVPPDYRHSNDFYLQDNLNGTASLTALRTFDRERQKEFLIPVVMSDSGVPAKTVTSMLTVTIGDQNDHAHLPGEKKIMINSHRGQRSCLLSSAVQ